MEQDEARHDDTIFQAETADTEQNTCLLCDTEIGSAGLHTAKRANHHAQWQSKESHNCGRRLLQQRLVFGEGQGKMATTCQAGESIEAVCIQHHLGGVLVLDFILCGSTGSQYHSSNDTMRMLGIEHRSLERTLNPLGGTSIDFAAYADQFAAAIAHPGTQSRYIV